MVTGQCCAWPGCKLTAKHLLCGRHLGSLPKRLRHAVADLPDLPDEVLAYIRQANDPAERAAEREAELWRRQGVLF